MFERSVTKHLNWYSGVESPFISLFCDEFHAENWARVWQSKNKDKEYCVLTIEINKEHDVALFSVPLLLSKLNIETKHPEYHRDEYLCLHNVPLEAIQGGSACKLLKYPNPILMSVG
jgi:hypothetical protein